MIQVTEPSMTAISQNAPDLTRSISEPETIDAVVQEKQQERRPEHAVEPGPQGGVRLGQAGAHRLAAHVRAHQLAPGRGERRGDDVAERPAIDHGRVKPPAEQIKGDAHDGNHHLFFSRVVRWFLRLETPTS